MHNAYLPQTARCSERWLSLLVPGAACLLAGLGVVLGQPLIALGLGLAVLAALPILAWPSACTLVVVFLLYTNAPVVAVRFHGVPTIVAAAVPLLLAVPIAQYVFVERRRFLVDHVSVLIALLLAIELISAVFSSNPRHSLNHVMTHFLEGFLLYLLILNAAGTKQVLRHVVWALLLAGAFMGALSGFQYATGTYHNKYAGFAQIEEGPGGATAVNAAKHHRLAGPLGAQNRYAQILLMLLPLGLVRCRAERRASLRGLAAGAVLLGALGIALTFSRGAAVGFVITMSAMRAAGCLSIFQGATLAVGIFVLLAAVPQYATRMVSMLPLVSLLDQDSAGIAAADGSIRSRYGEMLAAGLMFCENPVVGVGPGMYPHHYQTYAERVGTELNSAIKVKEELRQPHILYLGMAAELGIAGAGVFLAILFVVLRDLWRTHRYGQRTDPELASLAAGCLGALVAYMGTGLFLHFSYVRYFWMMLALCGATTQIAQRQGIVGGGEPTGTLPCSDGDAV